MASPDRAAHNFDALIARIHTLSRIAVIIGGSLMLLSAVGITIDVILRRILHLSTWGASEFSYYALAVSTSWSFAYALLVKAHIRIDALTQRLATPLRVACDVIAMVGLAAFAILATGAVYDLFERSWQRGSTSITTMATPLWIPQGLWLAGFAFFAFVSALLLLRVAFALLVERKLAPVDRYAGSPLLEDDIDSSTQSVAATRRSGTGTGQ
ncbi:TRAP transporter small permease [Fodinicurvata sp. EGI_FJ10296]|uniref:TRAP transporter small permease subunit n=1 Tax=Fodinicurvata sp. EGI_FJ10296 TaxID=3231908 RepID=UPI0034547BBC